MKKPKTLTTHLEPTPIAQLRRKGPPRPNRESPRLRRNVTDIAEAEGISRTSASKNANSPECRQLIAEFVSSEQDEMRAMFYRCLRVVDRALSATREYMTKDGQKCEFAL